MKARQQKPSNHTDKQYPLLPWDRQEAIMNFCMHRPATVPLPKMSDAEERFYCALMDLIDAYGHAADATYHEILSLKPIYR